MLETCFLQWTKYLNMCLLMATVHITDISNKLCRLINIVCVCVCGGGGVLFTNVIKPALLTVFDRHLHIYEKE